MKDNQASLAYLIENYRDLDYFKSDITAYLKNNNFREVYDDWFWSGKSWPVNEFLRTTKEMNNKLSLVY
jgi:hypothetical protein